MIADAAIHYKSETAADYRTSDTPAINAIHFGLPSNTSGAYEFDFCVTNIKLVLFETTENRVRALFKKIHRLLNYPRIPPS